MSEEIVLSGEGLKINNLARFIKDTSLTVSTRQEVRSRIERAGTFIAATLPSTVVYGINTGFGPMSSYIIHHDQLVALQYNLVRSHAVGIGEPLPDTYVIAAMLVRLNTFMKGHSGVSWELIEFLERVINERIVPEVPTHGAVGTSGDLVQLAHIALVLIGEGYASIRGKRMAAREAFRQAGLAPYQLQPKEGLALINGTSMMSGIGALICFQSERLHRLAVRMSAMALELVGGFWDGIDEHLHALRPHPGQIEVARQMRQMLSSSHLMRGRHEIAAKRDGDAEVYQLPNGVQEIYSFRCVPQILGPIWDAIGHTKTTIEREINAVTDNPIVDYEHNRFLHGGNFHGDYIACVLDQMKICLVKATMLMERQINFFLNKNVNKHYPPFLNLKTPGLTLGLQGLQFVATSTTAKSQTLAFPQYVHSISTNADNQDVVSMGTDAALIAAEVVEHAYIVSAVELITLAQAVDHLGVREKLSDSSRALYDAVRARLPAIIDDRDTTAELNPLVEYVKNDLEI